MKLEQLKTAWQREKAAYSREIDSNAIIADTKQKAMQMDRDFKR